MENQELMTTDLQMSEEVAGQQIENLITNTKQLNQIYKVGKIYSRSSMVPSNYQNNPDNCFVACELAGRMNVSPVLVMQNLYIVQGKPSWAGQACKALIDGCGKFKQSEYIFYGEYGQPEWGCRLQAVNITTGKKVQGSMVTWQMAKDEGWVDKKGSKWLTMPEQMIKYRAAAFFARSECPEVLMGYSTADEIEDVSKPEPEKIVLKMED